jgi:hypothetical protein
VTVGGSVLNDVANAIAETVEGLFVGYVLFPDFDLKKWRAKWAAADRTDVEDGEIETEENVTALIDIVVGAGGAFEEKRSRGLYQTRHTFSIAVKNSDRKHFLSNCKLFLDLPDFKDGTLRSYLLVDTFTLNASEERYVPIVSYDEPATVSRHAGDSIHLHIPVGVGYDVGCGWPWQLPLGAYSLTLRAICKETGPWQLVCKSWVDDAGKLHFEKA